MKGLPQSYAVKMQKLLLLERKREQQMIEGSLSTFLSGGYLDFLLRMRHPLSLRFSIFFRAHLSALLCRALHQKLADDRQLSGRILSNND